MFGDFLGQLLGGQQPQGVLGQEQAPGMMGMPQPPQQGLGPILGGLLATAIGGNRVGLGYAQGLDTANKTAHNQYTQKLRLWNMMDRARQRKEERDYRTSRDDIGDERYTTEFQRDEDRYTTGLKREDERNVIGDQFKQAGLDARFAEAQARRADANASRQIALDNLGISQERLALAQDAATQKQALPGKIDADLNNTLEALANVKFDPISTDRFDANANAAIEQQMERAAQLLARKNAYPNAVMEADLKIARSQIPDPRALRGDSRAKIDSFRRAQGLPIPGQAAPPATPVLAPGTPAAQAGADYWRAYGGGGLRGPGG